MFDRIIQLLMLAVTTISLIVTLTPPPNPPSVPRQEYAATCVSAVKDAQTTVYPVQLMYSWEAAGSARVFRWL